MNSTESEYETPYSVIADATLPNTAAPRVRSTVAIPPPPTTRPIHPRPRVPVVRNNSAVTSIRQSASDDLELRRKVQSLKTISRTIRCYLFLVLVCIGLSLISCGLMVSVMSQPVDHALRPTPSAITTETSTTTASSSKQTSTTTTTVKDVSTTRFTTSLKPRNSTYLTASTSIINTNTRPISSQSMTTEGIETTTVDASCYGNTCRNGGWCDPLDQVCVCNNAWFGPNCTLDGCNTGNVGCPTECNYGCNYSGIPCPVNVECIHEKDSALTYCNCTDPGDNRCTTAIVYAWYTAHASRPTRQFTLPNIDPNRFKTVEGQFQLDSTGLSPVYPNPVRPGCVANFNITSLDFQESSKIQMIYGSVDVRINSTNQKEFEHFGTNNFVIYVFYFEQMNPTDNFTIEFGATDLCSDYICNNGGTCGLPHSCTYGGAPPCHAVCHCVEPYFGPHCDSVRTTNAPASTTGG